MVDLRGYLEVRNVLSAHECEELIAQATTRGHGSRTTDRIAAASFRIGDRRSSTSWTTSGCCPI